MNIALCSPGHDVGNRLYYYRVHEIAAPLSRLGHRVRIIDCKRKIESGNARNISEALGGTPVPNAVDMIWYLFEEPGKNVFTEEFIFSVDDASSRQSILFCTGKHMPPADLSEKCRRVIYQDPDLAAPLRKSVGEKAVYLPHGCDPQMYFPQTAVARIPMLFVGSATDYRASILRSLISSRLEVMIFGMGWEPYTDLRKFSHGMVPPFRLRELFNMAEIVLQIPSTSDSCGLRSMVFNGAASGAFQMAPASIAPESPFSDGRQIVHYSSVGHLVELIRDWMPQESRRQAIGQSARRMVLTDHVIDENYKSLLAVRAKRNDPIEAAPRAVSEHRNDVRMSETERARPRVSIILNVYNGEQYIRETISSILEQHYPDFELVIYDDGSTDTTRLIAASFAGDQRIRYHYFENIGRNLDAFDELLNNTLKLCRGEFICFIGADDQYNPDKLDRQIAAFDSDPQLGIVFSNASTMDAHGHPLRHHYRFEESLSFGPENLLRRLFRINFIPHPTVMLRRRIIDALGGFESGFCPDYQFWLKAAPLFKFKYLDEKLCRYRIHPKGNSTGDGNRTLPETLKLLPVMRQRFTICDLYPELDRSDRSDVAFYAAYLDFGNRMMTASIPHADMAVREYQRALQHRPDGLEALNNLMIANFICGFEKEVADVASKIRTIEPIGDIINNNMALFENPAISRDQKIRNCRLLSQEMPLDRIFNRRHAEKCKADAAIPSKKQADKFAMVSETYPGIAHFLMIDKCNTKCIMCGGNYYHSRSGKRITRLEFERMARNLRLEKVQSVILAGAGDPLLNSDIVPIIKFLNAEYPNVGIQITTNGVALTRSMTQKILDCMVGSINVSINAASSESYNRIMQVDAFDKVCQNLQYVNELKKLRKQAFPSIQLSMPINLINIRELPKLILLAKNIGADGVNTFYTKFYPSKIRHLNIDHEDNKLKDEHCLYFHQELSDRMVEEARALSRQHGIYFLHEPMFKDDPHDCRCEWPWTQIMIGFDGEVLPCGGGELLFREKVARGTYHFGNARREAFEEFWNNNAYQRLRSGASDSGNHGLAECAACANKMNPNKLGYHIMNWEGFESDEIRVSGNPGSESKPLVSVIVPTFNRPEMLIDTIHSIQKQTYRPIEIIVVNDAGRDIESMSRGQDKEGVLKYIRHPFNQGLAAARNTGINAATGDYIAYLDDDDQFYPEHIETLVSFLESSDYEVAYTDALRAHQELHQERYVTVKKEWPPSYDFDHDRILFENYVPVLCFMHKKSCVHTAGGFDEALKRHEDWDFWIRISRYYKIAHIKKITCEFTSRKDGSSMTSGQKKEFRTTCERIFEKYAEYVKDRPMLRLAQGQMRSALRAAEAMELAWEGKVASGIDLMTECLDFDPENAQTHHVLGMLYKRQGDIRKAVRYLEKAVAICGHNRRYKRNLDIARGLLDSPGMDDDGTGHPTELDQLVALGEQQLADNQLYEASQTFQRAVDLDPSHIEAIFKLGEVALKAQMTESALFFFRRVHTLDSNHENAIRNIILCLEKLNRSDEAALVGGIGV
jgi:glycosyltransferase involved in cell wall biosynthesis